MKITKKYLQEHPDHIFVFGDNLLRLGYGGAAELRDEPNTYGFLTKKYPDNRESSFYAPIEYEGVYEREIRSLRAYILFFKAASPEKTFLISNLGSGLANKYKIFEKIIEPRIKKDLADFKNVKFLW